MNLTFGRKKTTPGQRFVASPPRVDVLPPAHRERLAAKRQRAAAVGVAGAVAIAVASVWGMGAIALGDLDQQVADATERGLELSQELAVYSPVTNLATQTEALNDTIRSQTSSTVDHGIALQRFIEAVGPYLDLKTFQLNTTSAGEGAGSSCVSTDPFNQVPLAGCISFTGDPLAGGASASAVLSALDANPWFVGPYLPALSSDGSLTGTVGLSVEALSDLGVVQDDEADDVAQPAADGQSDASIDGLPDPQQADPQAPTNGAGDDASTNETEDVQP